MALLTLLLAIVFIFSPINIIKIYRKQISIAEGFSAILPGNIAPFVKVILLSPIIRLLANSDWVTSAWCKQYNAGKTSFSWLEGELFELYARKPAVVDAWVARRIEGVRIQLEHQRRVLGVAQYVALPVLVKFGAETTDVARVTAQSLRNFFSPGRLVFGLVGEGGIGKTTLAYQIALWATRNKSEERLIADAPALSVVLYGTVSDPRKFVVNELKRAFDDYDELGFDTRIIDSALRLRRLMLVFDGLSEADIETQNRFRNIFSELPLQILIITARRSFPDILEHWIEATPSQITPATVNHFVSNYLRQLAPLTVSPEEELRISSRVVSLIKRRFGGSFIPPLFISLIIDTGDASVIESTSLPQTIQRYIRALGSKHGTELDKENFAEAATKMAGLSLGENLVPQEFLHKQAVTILPKDADKYIDAMLEAQILIGHVGPDGKRLRFRLDPVAEYLGAAEIIREKQLRVDLEAYFAALLSGHCHNSFAPALAETLASMRPRTAWRDALILSIQSESDYGTSGGGQDTDGDQKGKTKRQANPILV